MKMLKLALVITFASMLAIACNSNTNSTTDRAANTPPQTTATAVPVPSAAKAAATPDEFASIRATYSATCIRCHKANGEGGVATLDEGKEPLKVPSFKEGHALRHTDQQFARQIANGGDGMPPFKTRLTPEQINELVRFIRHEFQGQANAASPGASANTAAPPSSNAKPAEKK